MAYDHLRGCARCDAPRCASAARPRLHARARRRHPLRERHRPRPPRARRAIHGHPLRARIAAVLADVVRFCETAPRALTLRTGSHLRARCSALRTRLCRRCHSGRHPGRTFRWSARRPRERTVRAPVGNAGHAGDRCGKRDGHERHHRQDSLHLRFDGFAEGRDQHAADAMREPADEPPGVSVFRRRNDDAGLVAVESHGRLEPSLQHGALQRRHALHRRR